MSQYFLAGNLWLIFAVIAFVGRKTVRVMPVYEQFFGVGRDFTPNEYTTLIAGLVSAAMVCFVLQWRSSRPQS